MSPFNFLPEGLGTFVVTGSASNPNSPTKLTRVNSQTEYDRTVAAFVAEGKQVWTTFAGFRQLKSGEYNRRRSEDVSALQCFVMDIDLGEKNGKVGYATKGEAFTAIRDAVTGGQMLKPSLVVDSGNGLHLWWLLDAPITKAVWKETAEALKNYYVETLPRLTIDPSRLSDPSGLLRAWPSVNLKDPTNPKPVKASMPTGAVYSLQNFKDLAGLVTSVATPKTAKPAPTPTKELEKPKAVTKVPANELANACALTRHYYKNVRPTADEPAWRAAVQLACFTVEGVKVAQHFSKGHQGYDPLATEEKFYQANNYVEGGAGPSSCSKLREVWLGNANDMSICQGCPLVSKLNWKPNPVNAVLSSRETKAAAPSAKSEAIIQQINAEGITTAKELQTIAIAGHAPPEWINDSELFKWAEDGNRDAPVYVRLSGEDEEPAHAIAFSTVWWLNGHDCRSGQTKLYVRRKYGALYNTYMTPICASSFSTVAKARDVLTKHGAGIPMDAGKATVAMAIRYMQACLDNQEAGEYQTTFGWNEDVNEFTVGNITVQSDGSLRRAMLSGDAEARAMDFKPHGSAVEQAKHLNYYAKYGNPVSKFAATLGFASPLIRLYKKEMGAIVHLNGRTGKGKTTLLKYINSTFGDYESTSAIASKAASDTEKGIASLMAIRKNFALGYDELSTAGAKELQQLTLGFTSGRSNHKRNQNGTMNHSNSEGWACIMVTTANQSLQETLAGTDDLAGAAQARVLELPFTETVSQAALLAGEGITVDGFDRAVANNCGILGIKFMQYVLPRADEIGKEIEKARDAIGAKYGMSSERRFELNTLAAYAVASRIIRSLGWWDDVQTVEQTLDEIIRISEDNREDLRATVMGDMHEFVREVQEYTATARLVEEGPNKGKLHVAELSHGKIPKAYRYETATGPELEFEIGTFRDAYKKKNGSGKNLREMYRHLTEIGAMVMPIEIALVKQPWLHKGVDFHREHPLHKGGHKSDVVRIKLTKEK